MIGRFKSGLFQNGLFETEDLVRIRLVQPDESHAALEAVCVELQVSDHIDAGRNHYLLGRIAQGDLDQRGALHAHLQKVRHQAANLGKAYRCGFL